MTLPSLRPCFAPELALAGAGEEQAGQGCQHDQVQSHQSALQQQQQQQSWLPAQGAAAARLPRGCGQSLMPDLWLDAVAGVSWSPHWPKASRQH